MITALPNEPKDTPYLMRANRIRVITKNTYDRYFDNEYDPPYLLIT